MHRCTNLWDPYCSKSESDLDFWRSFNFGREPPRSMHGFLEANLAYTFRGDVVWSFTRRWFHVNENEKKKKKKNGKNPKFHNSFNNVGRDTIWSHVVENGKKNHTQFKTLKNTTEQNKCLEIWWTCSFHPNNWRYFAWRFLRKRVLRTDDRWQIAQSRAKNDGVQKYIASEFFQIIAQSNLC